MPTILTICDTCKRADWDPDTASETDGAALFRQVTAAEKINPKLTIRAKTCLMGCDFACNVTLQNPEKISYAIGMFEPTKEAAEAILDYADKYIESKTGQVPYKTWPQGIKGHFRSRTYPPEMDEG